MINDVISDHLAFFCCSLLFFIFSKSLVRLFQLIGLWFALWVGTLAATVTSSLSPAENTKLAPASTSLGPVYREARDYGAHETSSYNNRPYDRPQQSRCISCLYAAMTGNQDRER